MDYHVDGFLLGPNPCPKGGGFTVTDEHGTLIMHHVFFRTMTNNEAELWAIAYAAHRAQAHDVIWTDSQTAEHWVSVGFCKSRKDLNALCAKIHAWIMGKQLKIQWCERSMNAAGVYNESACHV